MKKWSEKGKDAANGDHVRANRIGHDFYHHVVGFVLCRRHTSSSHLILPPTRHYPTYTSNAQNYRTVARAKKKWRKQRNNAENGDQNWTRVLPPCGLFCFVPPSYFLESFVSTTYLALHNLYIERAELPDGCEGVKKWRKQRNDAENGEHMLRACGGS